MSYPIQVTPVSDGRGARYWNASPVDQVVTVKDGPDTPEAVLAGKRRTIRMLLKPGESRIVDVSGEAVMTHSTDTSSMQGTVTLFVGAYVSEVRCESCRVTLRLTKEALVSVETGGDLWSASVDGFNGTGLSQEEALRELGMELHSTLLMIGQEDDEKLTEDAKELKKKILALVKETGETAK